MPRKKTEAITEEKIVIVPTDPENIKDLRTQEDRAKLEAWVPKTGLGKRVKNREITDIDCILDEGKVILEPEITDTLLQMESELLLIGQSKGKFGGGQRRVFRQTQKKTKEGNKPKFTTLAVIGDRNGHIGLGLGKAKETVPAREKAIKQAKLNIFKIRRGCGSWQCNCKESHTIPFTVKGKCGSVELVLMPAPKGKGLCIQSECAKILALAGIKDVWSKTRGQTRNRVNLVYACEEALKRLSQVKVQAKYENALNMIEGKIEVKKEVKKEKEEEKEEKGKKEDGHQKQD